jgi:hypothetical protein
MRRSCHAPQRLSGPCIVEENIMLKMTGAAAPRLQ